jgi:hypothetical protein
MCVTERPAPPPSDTIDAMTIPIRILAAFIGLTCAAPASASPLSATRDVIAILAGELFVGEAEGHLDGSGTLVIHAQLNPALTCRGEFTSRDKTGGAGQLRCSDGAIATFNFARLSVFRGSGAGAHSRGPMSFSYGMDPEQASPYLNLPEGKRLIHNGTELAMVDR